MELSKLSQNYPASMIRKMFEQAREYENVLYFTMGEPSFVSPGRVKEAAKKSIDNNNTFYGPNAGEDYLREKIAEQYNQLYRSNYTKENVLVTFGATEGILLAMMATLNRGDEVIIFTPHYPNYVGQIESIGAKPVFVQMKKENNFKINFEDIEAKRTSKTKMLIINSPNNPLGTVIDHETFIKLGEYTKEHNLFLLADEVYHNLIYEGSKHYSFASPQQDNYDNSFIIDSFSKTYSMTGYRIGFVITKDTAAIQAMTEFKEGIAFAVPTFIQDAAYEALDSAEEDFNEMYEVYSRRRNLITEGLNQIKGIKTLPVQGAFYLFVDITFFGRSSEEFAFKLLEEERVALLPGTSFGEAGEGYLRISYASSDENIKEMIPRLERFTKRFMN